MSLDPANVKLHLQKVVKPMPLNSLHLLKDQPVLHVEKVLQLAKLLLMLHHLHPLLVP